MKFIEHSNGIRGATEELRSNAPPFLRLVIVLRVEDGDCGGSHRIARRRVAIAPIQDDAIRDDLERILAQPPHVLDETCTSPARSLVAAEQLIQDGKRMNL